jgi:hypothetical protein
MTALLKIFPVSIVAFPACPAVEAGNSYRVQMGRT